MVTKLKIALAQLNPLVGDVIGNTKKLIDVRSKLDNDVKFKPNYRWPKEGSEKMCPKCSKALQLQENLPQYYGKPWWCHFCQWQFSEDDLKSKDFQK